jgi:hypothetical protein
LIASVNAKITFWDIEAPGKARRRRNARLILSSIGLRVSVVGAPHSFAACESREMDWRFLNVCDFLVLRDLSEFELISGCF